MYNTLEEIEAQIKICKNCQLCEQAKNAVPGKGNKNAEILFIGEAPGRNEDIKGEPFVGAAGKFLDTLLNEINLKREDIYITNIVKHRPPNNRDPKPEEVKKCWPFLEAQINIIKPKLIVTLGRHAMHRFMPTLQISKVHGTAKIVTGIFKEKQIFFPMYHPASALYNPGLRSTLIEDIKKIPILLKKIKDESQ